MPSSMTVAPPSGTALLAEAENDQEVGLTPLDGSWVVKLQVIAVGSKLLPLTTPTPLTTTKPLTPAVPPCDTMDEDNRLNVNPPTAQKGFTELPVLKFHGAVKTAGVLLATTANEPASPETTGAIQEVTAVAVEAELLSKVTPMPEKPMLPVIAVA